MVGARLILEDGTVFEGESFGAAADAVGEVVFNTSQTGYQEIVTDPSYRFQIVVMTTPHIGNYGTSDSVAQSDRPQAAGMIVRELSALPSDPATRSLTDYFTQYKVSGLTGVDTRAITLKIRSEGAMRGMITSNPEKTAGEIVETLRKSPTMAGLDLVSRVTALRPYPFETKIGHRGNYRIAVYDFGVKRDILRQLSARGCDVVVYPATTHADEILNLRFDAVVLSNGPGDPEPVTYAQDNIRRLIGKVPLLGICLGHQLLGIALGGKTFKLKFGHRGGNHPVKHVQTGRVEITAQNHGFAVDPDSLDLSAMDITHVNLNDGTLEGFRHRNEPILAVQFHPEAAPGPHDSLQLFDEFLRLVDEVRSR